jgi:hypothetical protein
VDERLETVRVLVELVALGRDVATLAVLAVVIPVLLRRKG